MHLRCVVVAGIPRAPEERPGMAQDDLVARDLRCRRDANAVPDGVFASPGP
ncbi:hypothetical protein HY464_02995, partial [Candidatus Peregrinibacteria bacterium]|nr:hypothetical protein [Candidatus Peregrinibacteria bacterium]